MQDEAIVEQGAESHTRPEDADAMHSGPSRRSFLTKTGIGMAVLAAGGAGGRGAIYLDRASARARADGATVAELSAATTVQVLWRGNTSEKVIALTFDDGPGPTLTSPLLDVLRDEKVRATFSLVGRQAFKRRDLVRAQVKYGHELANHTWSHADLSLMDYGDVKQQLERTDTLLHELTGVRPALIRPPFGRVSGALLQHAAMSHQHVCLWDMQMHEARYDSAGNADYVLSNLRPGTVLLAHDAGSRNRYIGVNAMPAIIRGAKDRGYEFVTASEMLALKPS